MLLTQCKYICDFLTKENMQCYKSISIPMSNTYKLFAIEGEQFKNPCLYRGIVGALQYITITRIDLSFIVKKVF